MSETVYVITSHNCSQCGGTAFVRPGPTFNSTWEECKDCGYYGPMKNKEELTSG